MFSILGLSQHFQFWGFPLQFDVGAHNYYTYTDTITLQKIQSIFFFALTEHHSQDIQQWSSKHHYNKQQYGQLQSL